MTTRTFSLLGAAFWLTLGTLGGSVRAAADTITVAGVYTQSV